MVAAANPDRYHSLRSAAHFCAKLHLGTVYLYACLMISRGQEPFDKLRTGGRASVNTFSAYIALYVSLGISPYSSYDLSMSKLSIFTDVWAFMRVRKKWWLLPLVLLITLLGLILIFAQGSALAPFIYTVF